MKVLIISAEVWRDDSNGGNVLSNMFGGFNWEFAQIYCNPGMPDNGICTKYYQITDSMVLHNFIKYTPVGQAFDLDKITTNNNVNIEQPNKKFYDFFHAHKWNIFYFFKHFLWNHSNWRNENLKRFITDFSPDIIFAPCYGDCFLLKLTQYVSQITKKSIISYISDDNYTLKQFNLSFFYWMDRFKVRRQMRKTFPLYSLVYTMTEQQKIQCERDFGAKMKLLMKPSSSLCEQINFDIKFPIKLVYAGGIYLNRWKTLRKFVQAIKSINIDKKYFELAIYTQNEITQKLKKKLHDGVNTFLYSAVTQKQLREIYLNSHIALHVESFDLKNMLQVRMSFSTKITDLLASGCAIIAVCDKNQGGYRYLEKENAAICIDNPKKIIEKLKYIKENPKLIKDYKVLARECLNRNHNPEQIHRMIETDFNSVCAGV